MARIFRNSLTAWHFAKGEFLTQPQIIHKIAQMFKGTGETADADFLSGYMQVGVIILPFEDILYDIDCLYKVNKIGNIVNALDFKATTAQEAIGKIERLSKLVQGGQVSICDILMAGAIRDNIPDGSKIALVNTMALLDREREQVRFTEFKAAFKQTFTTTPPPLRHILWPKPQWEL